MEETVLTDGLTVAGPSEDSAAADTDVETVRGAHGSRRRAIALREVDWEDADAPEAHLGPATAHAVGLLAALEGRPIALTGETGLLTALVRAVLQTGLKAELAAHLGHGRWEWTSRGAENIRNGAYAKRVITDLGTIMVQMPRDRRGTFDPVIVPKHGRRLIAPGAQVASLYASGMTRTELRTVIDLVTHSRLEPEVLDGYLDELEPDVRSWQRRRFPSSCPLLLIDSITLPGRGRRPSRRQIDVAVAVDSHGGVELLGLWRRQTRAAGAARYTQMLDELHYRGISVVELICGGGGDELASAAALIWPGAHVRSGVESRVENLIRTVG